MRKNLESNRSNKRGSDKNSGLRRQHKMWPIVTLKIHLEPLSLNLKIMKGVRVFLENPWLSLRKESSKIKGNG
jgi:hypothetical protein